jgi:hypothetical protein
MDPLPSSKGVVATAGKTPLEVSIDLNQDGVNDVEQLLAIAKKNQPLAEAGIRVVLMALGLFGKQNTLPYRYLDAYFTQAKPKVDAVLGTKP